MRDRGGDHPGVRSIVAGVLQQLLQNFSFFLSLFALLLAVAVEQINSSVKTSAQILDFNWMMISWLLWRGYFFPRDWFPTAQSENREKLTFNWWLIRNHYQGVIILLITKINIHFFCVQRKKRFSFERQKCCQQCLSRQGFIQKKDESQFLPVLHQITKNWHGDAIFLLFFRTGTKKFWPTFQIRQLLMKDWFYFSRNFEFRAISGLGVKLRLMYLNRDLLLIFTTDYEALRPSGCSN